MSMPISLSLSASAGAPTGPPAAVRAPQDVLSGVRVASQLLQDFRPITESIEWELGHLHWAQAGLLTFAENEVPYVVNNSGRLSEDAAALLFHHCADTAPQGTIAVLELGAGCGLFARMFLQAFRHLCQQEGRDFDQRLVCYVTDGSPRTVAQWHERGLFAEFGGQVVAGCCDAMHPEAVRLHDGSTVPLPPLHAVFCNYVLDVLPATVVRRQNGGPVQELRIRTRLTDDAQLVRQYTALSPHEIRALVDHADAAERARLLPLVGLFEQETGFFDCGDAALSPWVDAALSVSQDATRLLVNHGAFGALQTLQQRLAPKGLVLINDYGACTPEAAAQSGASQRFGRTSAIGLNFPLLAQLFGREGWQVLAPSGDAQRAIHARLLIGEGCERTAAAFSTASAPTRSSSSRPRPMRPARTWSRAGRTPRWKATARPSPAARATGACWARWRSSWACSCGTLRQASSWRAARWSSTPGSAPGCGTCWATACSARSSLLPRMTPTCRPSA